MYAKLGYAWLHGPWADAEKAKRILAPLFSTKRLSRKFVDIWRVDLDRLVLCYLSTLFQYVATIDPSFRPGKFESYRRKYLALYISVLRQTCDMNALDVICFKLAKVHPPYAPWILSDIGIRVPRSFFTIGRIV